VLITIYSVSKQIHFQQIKVTGPDLTDSKQCLMRRFKAPSKSKGSKKRI